MKAALVAVTVCCLPQALGFGAGALCVRHHVAPAGAGAAAQCRMAALVAQPSGRPPRRDALAALSWQILRAAGAVLLPAVVVGQPQGAWAMRSFEEVPFFCWRRCCGSSAALRCGANLREGGRGREGGRERETARAIERAIAVAPTSSLRDRERERESEGERERERREERGERRERVRVREAHARASSCLCVCVCGCVCVCMRMPLKASGVLLTICAACFGIVRGRQGRSAARTWRDQGRGRSALA